MGVKVSSPKDLKREGSVAPRSKPRKSSRSSAAADELKLSGAIVDRSFGELEAQAALKSRPGTGDIPTPNSFSDLPFVAYKKGSEEVSATCVSDEQEMEWSKSMSVSLSLLDQMYQRRLSASRNSLNAGNDGVQLFSSSRLSNNQLGSSLIVHNERKKSAAQAFFWDIGKNVQRKPHEPRNEYVERVFATLDTDNDNFISKAELEKEIKVDESIGSVEDSSFSAVFFIADRDDDGRLTRDEFLTLFRHVGCDDENTGPVDEDDKDVYDAMERSGAGSTSKLSSVVLNSTPSFYSRSDNLGEKKPRLPRNIAITSLPSQADRIKSVAISPMPDTFAVSHRNDPVVHLYNYRGSEVRRLVGHIDAVLSVAFSPDRRVIASSARDCNVIVWDATVGHELRCIEHPGVVTGLSFSHDGRFLYTGCQDNYVRQLEVKQATLLATTPELACPVPGVIMALVTHPLNNSVVVYSSSGTKSAYVAETDFLETTHTLSGHEGLVWQASFSSDGTTLLTSSERILIVWEAANFTALRVLSSSDCHSTPTPDCLWTTAVFGPSEYSYLLFAFNTYRELVVIDYNEQKIVYDAELSAPVFTTTTFKNKSLICGDDDGNVYKFTL